MRTFFLLVMLLATQWPLFSQTKIQRHLESIEQQRFEAMTTKNVAFLQEVLAEDLTYTHSNGLFETKKVHIDNIQSGNLVYQSIKVESMSVRVYGKSAVITGIATVGGILKGKEFSLRLRYSDVYVKKKGKWRLVAWQSLKLE
jgi:hypothetical protein